MPIASPSIAGSIRASDDLLHDLLLGAETGNAREYGTIERELKVKWLHLEYHVL
jgi:hypothetical protein